MSKSRKSKVPGSPPYYTTVGRYLFNAFRSADAPARAPEAPEGAASAADFSTKADPDETNSKFPEMTRFVQLFLGPMVLPGHNKPAEEDVWEAQKNCLAQYQAVVDRLLREEGLTPELTDPSERVRTLTDALNCKKDGSDVFYQKMHTNSTYANKTSNYITEKRYFSYYSYPCTQLQNAPDHEQNEWNTALRQCIQAVDTLYEAELQWIFRGNEPMLRSKINYLKKNCLPVGGSFLTPEDLRDGHILSCALLYAACQNENDSVRAPLYELFHFPQESVSSRQPLRVEISLKDFTNLGQLLQSDGFRATLSQSGYLMQFVQSLMPLATALPPHDPCRYALIQFLWDEHDHLCQKRRSENDRAKRLQLKEDADTLEELADKLSPAEDA